MHAMTEFRRKENLPKLERHRYQGFAVVFWTLTVQGRPDQWLNTQFHTLFRQMMLHAAAREALMCPAYCLMPDHLHFVWMGLRQATDQLNAVKFLRVQLEPGLGGGHEWQHQAYDHVLREDERKRNAFAQTCFYILANPVRAKLAMHEGEWPFSGAVIPGYPILHPLKADFWDLFWKLYAQAREMASSA